jgi:SAM-dependent methyltransferase
MPISPEPRFDAARARRYWRHAPSGAGKHDTGALVASHGLHDVWDDAFRSRLLNYPEEEQFLRTFAERAPGLRMVSIGSGLGFHELFYAAAGARVTCCDIVETNLAAIAKVAGRKALNVDIVHADDVGAQPLPGDADLVFIYGCLMHMPDDAQRALLARAHRALAPGGSIVLMLYAWEFPRRICGWLSPAEFDPVAFARASDPTVAGEACPWSDWHDAAKLLSLVEPSARIVRSQAWNDGQFLWYEIAGANHFGAPRAFFDDGSVTRRWRFSTVRTPASSGRYAVESETMSAPAGANAVAVDLSVEEGAFSAGILDADAERFVAVATCSVPGRRTTLLLADPLPATFRIVISTNQPAAPASGLFHLYGARVLRRPLAWMPAPASVRE